MKINITSLAHLKNDELIRSTHRVLANERGVTTELIIHLGEIDARSLFIELGFKSMHQYCIDELAFSEDAAFNRIVVARAARRLPSLVDVLRTGRVHLSGLRLMAPVLTVENHEELLAKATGKSKRQIEAMLGKLAEVPTATPRLAPRKRRSSSKTVIRSPKAPDGIPFIRSDSLSKKVRRAQDLLKNEVPDGDIAQILERALDLLIATSEKRAPAAKKLETGRDRRSLVSTTPRSTPQPGPARCVFVDGSGRRCRATAGPSEGRKRTESHDHPKVVKTAKLCRTHARVVASAKRENRGAPPALPANTRPGTTKIEAKVRRPNRSRLK